MSTRMVMSIAFVLAVVLGMLLYIINDTRRADSSNQDVIAHNMEKGQELFGANCSQCHGPLGEGAIGPALNRASWHPGNKDFDLNATTDFLKKVLTRGQYSPQPGIAMPAWSRDFGGAFTDEQIDQVITFIIYGDWESLQSILPHTANPNYLADLPANNTMKAKFPDAAAKTPEGEKQKAALAVDLGDMKKLIMGKGCLNCHALGSAGTTLGPNLTEVGSRRSRDWLYKWIEDPSKVDASNRGPNVLPWFQQYAVPRSDYWPMNPTWMPTITMTVDERNKIVDYLAGMLSPPSKLQQAGAPPTATPTK